MGLSRGKEDQILNFVICGMNLENLTPAMKQYLQMKQQNPDCILLFRIGDFYEVFFEDAKICASVLDSVVSSEDIVSSLE